MIRLSDISLPPEHSAHQLPFEAARMLRNNCVYTDIAARTGLSTATISRVNRCLKYGNDGYNKVLDRLDAAEPSGDGTDRS